MMAGFGHVASGSALFVGTPPVPAAAASISEEVPAGAPIQLHRDNDGLFYVTAIVNDRPVRFVVDTGASVVVLSEADAARAGVVGNTPAGEITTANGTATMRWARADSVRIGPQEFRDVPVTVAPQSSVSLIGESLISRFDQVTISGNHMSLR